MIKKKKGAREHLGESVYWGGGKKKGCPPWKREDNPMKGGRVHKRENRRTTKQTTFEYGKMCKTVDHTKEKGRSKNSTFIHTQTQQKLRTNRGSMPKRGESLETPWRDASSP